MKRLFALATAFLFLTPAFVFADTPTVTLTPAVLASQLQTIQTQVNGMLGSSTPFLGTPYTLTPGEEIVEPDGALALQFTAFAHTNPVPSMPSLPVTNFAQFTLEENPCATATSSSCVNPNHAVKPLMYAGQSNNYLSYIVKLTALSSTTATVVVDNPTFFIQMKSELNTVTNELHFLFNS